MKNRPVERDASITMVLESLKRDVKRRADRVGAAAEAWIDLAPAAVVEVSAIEGFRAGTLEVAVAGASAKFLVDRSLREGLEARLRDRLPALRKVRVRTDAASILDDPARDEPREEPRPPAAAPRSSRRSAQRRRDL